MNFQTMQKEIERIRKSDIADRMLNDIKKTIEKGEEMIKEHKKHFQYA